MLERCSSEIDQQSELQLTQTHVGKYLPFVHWHQLFQGFYLHYYFSIYEKINAKCVFKNQTFILKHYRKLALNLQALALKFKCKDSLINRLQQPWAKPLMNFERSINDLSRDFVLVHLFFAPFAFFASLREKLLASQSAARTFS